MDNRISPVRPDVVSVQTAPRPTPAPVRVHFSEVLSGGAQILVRGAQAAVRALPGSPLMAVAVRGGAGTGLPASTTMGVSLGSSSVFSASGTAPEGPGGVGAVGVGVGTVGVDPTGAPGAATGTDATGGIEGSIQQSEALNLYYLQIQEEVNAQSRTFTTLSNVLEVEHNTAKAAIGNIH